MGHLIDIIEARMKNKTAVNSVDELKAEVSGLKEKLSKLESGVSSILSILSRKEE